MSDHAERLRHMAKNWLRAAEDQENYHTRAERINSGKYYRNNAAALLAGAEALERERGTVKVQWDTEGGATKHGLYLWAGAVCNGFGSLVKKGKKRLYLDWHPTLEAARAAAVAWVDEQEGK